MRIKQPLGRKHAIGLALGALAVSNVVGNRFVPITARVPWNLAQTALLLALARSAGEDHHALGISRRRLADGWKHGVRSAAMVAGGYLALLSHPRTRTLLHDQRLLDLSERAVAWRLLVGIPLGTALAEEVAFRGVLPALLDSPHWPPWLAPAITSTLFGLWHLLPSHEQMKANGSHRSLVGVSAVATAVGGAVLHGLRQKAGHLLAPITLHAATNGIGLLAVRLVGIRG